MHMQELIVDTQSVVGQTGRVYRYTYSILVDEMDVGRFSCESYGVKIRDEISGHTAAVAHITPSIPRIDELMELLIRNEVTPTGLRDVLDDWL